MSRCPPCRVDVELREQRERRPKKKRRRRRKDDDGFLWLFFAFALPKLLKLNTSSTPEPSPSPSGQVKVPSTQGQTNAGEPVPPIQDPNKVPQPMPGVPTNPPTTIDVPPIEVIP